MTSEPNGLEIAIIGISGRFPKSHTIDEFWENLKNGVELISEFPKSQQNSQVTSTGHQQAPQTIKAGSVLDNVEQFDASFFGFNPREAEAMDPQHRLFLECAWEALENAGYDTEREERPIGVYAGVGMSTYSFHNLYPNRELMESRGFLQTLVGIDKDYVPTRVSYKLNLKGPSISVGTACSSSLVAVHLACQSLLSGECDMALAAGVSVKVPQNELTLFPEEIVSPDGHCRAFDGKANGTIAGNGIGVVVLKRLEDALADGDYIYAVIKGSAINNDGALKVGYTAPSEEGQARVIRAAQVMAEVEPDTISYMETHGTGTPLGDPIEIAAMTRAFRGTTDKKGYCAIGSVKTNVGHLDAAAGITGLIKTALALHHQLLPPSLNFETPNPQIDFENSPFYVNTQCSEWKTNGTPRRAGVSSFGFGGTNVHVILEEAPAVGQQGKQGVGVNVLETTDTLTGQQERQSHLLVISAKTRSALATATTNLAYHLKQHPDLNLADIAYTLQVGRRRFEHRRMVVAKDLEDAVNALESENPQRVFTQFQESSDRSIVFLCTGQGAQYVNMARELYQSEPTFRAECDRCFALLQPHLGIDLRSCFYPTAEEVEKAAEQLQQTAITQPALFVIEYALAKLWMSWGVQPQAMIGHSIGEYVAACLAGVFGLEDALALVATRGRLMQQMPAGAMVSVNLSADDVQPFLGEKRSLAASNAPCLSVVSGSVEAVEELEQQLEAKEIGYRRLHTSHAFHSPMMNPIVGAFTQHLTTIKLNPPQIPFISNVTGTWITAAEATDPNYWARHLRQGVRFAEGIAELLKDAQAIFLEVGPGRTLSTLTKQQATERVVLSSLRHPQDKQSDVAFILNTLGKLWLEGVQVDWSGFHLHEKRDLLKAARLRYRIPLPTYPFERQRYWIDPPEESANSRQVTLSKKPNIADWFYVPSWKRSITSTCKVNGTSVHSSILVFVDECGLGVQLVEHLQQASQDVIIVKVGSGFSQLSDGVYSLNPRQKDDYKALVDALITQDKRPSKIVHLWNVNNKKTGIYSGVFQPNLHPELEFGLIKYAQDLGFYSLLLLAQALGKQNLADNVKILVVSNNLQDVTGEEILCPEKATLLGPVNVISQEYPNVNCKSIDVVIPATEKLVDQLLAELAIQSSDRIIAYRGNHRWVQTFEPIRLEDAVEGTSRLRKGGVYLITGGLGGIGLVLAEYLAKTVQAKLILTGRSAFPTKDEWEQWLVTHDEQDSISRKIRKVRELEALGAEVLVASVDVANLTQMQSLIHQVELRFGELNGVFHAAGILGGQFNTVENTSEANCEQQFHPKVYGLLVLEKVLQCREIDFCVLLSSLSTVLGGLGSVAYSSANLFMDAFTQQHHQTRSISWMSINWDSWQIGEDSSKSASWGSTLAEFAITSQEGVKAFQCLLSNSGLSQVVVSTGDLQGRMNQWIKLESSQEKAAAKSSNALSFYSRPDLQNDYIAPRNEIEQKIYHIWQELLGMKQIGIYDNFFELGGHSLLATQLISRIRKKFQLELPVNILFNAPTIADISEYIETKINAVIPVELGDREEGEL
ncbi:SDR family NAD(P)-dependent oxidoreductase [Coleofasciculus sp. G2-EDA-02]|uniref:SDR family NAD(P)-dependent oxidoreductase n=1 Tax=Coleofasciculus sp. G2-EDA-02 TaxID=3069529 RepID=UPI0032F4C1A8